MASDVVGISDPDEVKRFRAKYLYLARTKRRIQNRLADIDWEYDVLRPGLRQIEQRITIVGELPEITFDLDEPQD